MLIRFLYTILLLLGICHHSQAKEIELNEAILVHLYGTVIQANSSQAVTSLKTLQQQLLQQHPQTPDWSLLQNCFRQFALHWKAVEITYIAGDLDDDYLDHPRYIDFYHQGNDSIDRLVERAIASSLPLSKALFKNSTKGINALEVMLFPEQHLTPTQAKRRLQGALLSTQHIRKWLVAINDFYQRDQSFIQGGTTSLSLLVNRLIDSSYQLAHWRVGEAAGLTPKTAGTLQPQRLEFSRAGISKAVIAEILQTHGYIIHNEANLDLLRVSTTLGTADDMRFLQTRLQVSQQVLQEVPEPFAEHLQDDSYEVLFQQLAMLHNAYYLVLINGLNLPAHILNADGD